MGKADDIPDRERLLKTAWLWAKSQSALTGKINGGGWFANDQAVLYASREYLDEASGRLLTVRSNPILVTLYEATP